MENREFSLSPIHSATQAMAEIPVNEKASENDEGSCEKLESTIIVFIFLAKSDDDDSEDKDWPSKKLGRR